MIGPHQGKELELMLAGEKHMAIFCDAIGKDGNISEEIIPEQAFAPHVESGKILRFCSEEYDPSHKIIVRKVYFTTKGNEWRVQALAWMLEECIAKRRPFDDAYEYFVGRLLGYSEEDIQHYIEHWKAHRESQRASA